MRYDQLMRNAQAQRQIYLADLTASCIVWAVEKTKIALNWLKITFSAVEEGSQKYNRLKNVCSFDH